MPGRTGLAFSDNADEAANIQLLSAAQTEADVAPGEVIVVYEDALNAANEEQTEAEVEQSLDDATSVKVEDAEVLASELGDMGTVVQVTLEDGASVEAAVEEISQVEGVAYAQPNYAYSLLEDESDDAALEELDAQEASLQSTTVDDPDLFYQYYLGEWNEPSSKKCGANVEEAWDTARCENTVTIAILDTGCDMDHEDLQGNLLSDLAYNATDADSVNDTNGHGTHCAGLAGAVANNSIGVAGSSYNANILPIKVFDDNGNCYDDDLIEAYEYLDKLIESGDLNDLHVINMSLGAYSSGEGYWDRALEKVIKEMRDNHNVLTVCAGGNGDANGNAYVDTPMYPSDFGECFSVTALDRYGKNCAWSDYNSRKDISAPGYWMWSTVPITDDDPDGYAYKSGTSMASPLVAGIAALLWEVDPNLTVDDAVEAMEETTNDVNSPSEDWVEKCGSAGAIDAAAAVDYVASEMPGQYTVITLVDDQDEELDRLVVNVDEDETTTVKLPEITGYEPVDCPNYTLDVAYETDDVKKITVKYQRVLTASLSYTTLHYTGYARTPTVTVKYGSETIANKVSASNDKVDIVYDKGRKNVGTYNVKVTGKNGVSGEVTLSFTIEPTKITASNVSLSSTSYTYDGKAKKPAVTMKGFTEGTDYTVTYASDCTNAGKKTLVVKGNGTNTTGSAKVTYTVKKATPTVKITTSTLSTKASSLKSKAQTLTALKTSGVQGTATFERVCGSSKLTISKDGKIQVKKGTKAGSYTIKVKVTSAATTNYNAASTTKIITVVVK